MIIYSVTVKIESAIEQDWVTWMRNVHIPDVMNTGLFQEYRMSKVLVQDPDGVNYSIQYLCPSEDQLNTYLNEHAKALQEEHTARYKDQFVAFRTLLEVVDQKSI